MRHQYVRIHDHTQKHQKYATQQIGPAKAAGNEVNQQTITPHYLSPFNLFLLKNDKYLVTE
jgi:hypothetical protein